MTTRDVYHLDFFDIDTNTDTLIMIPIFLTIQIPILLQLNVNIFYSTQKKTSFLRIKGSQFVDFFRISLLIYCSRRTIFKMM